MSEVLSVLQKGRPPICRVKCKCGRIYRASGWKHYFRNLTACAACRFQWNSEQAKEMGKLAIKAKQLYKSLNLPK